MLQVKVLILQQQQKKKLLENEKFLIDWTNTIEGITLKFKVFLLQLVMEFSRIKLLKFLKL